MSAARDILIRAQEPADFAALAEVFSQPGVIWGTLVTPFITDEARRRALSPDTANVMRLVAVVEEKVVGGASLHRHERHRRGHAASLGMGVHDAYVGRGVGTAFMSAIVGVADNWWNLTRLELEVFADNDRAVALYERFGFEREGLFRAHAFREGRLVDTIAMGRIRPCDPLSGAAFQGAPPGATPPG